MPTRSGKTFSVGETSAQIDTSLKDTLNTSIARMYQAGLQEFRHQANTNCRDLATRLERL